MKPNRLLDTGLLLLAIIIAYLFSMTNPNLDKMEMDAILNYFVPGILGLIAVGLFLLFSFVFKAAYLSARWVIVGLLGCLLIIAGLWLHYTP